MVVEGAVEDVVGLVEVEVVVPGKVEVVDVVVGMVVLVVVVEVVVEVVVVVGRL